MRRPFKFSGAPEHQLSVLLINHNAAQPDCAVWFVEYTESPTPESRKKNNGLCSLNIFRIIYCFNIKELFSAQLHMMLWWNQQITNKKVYGPRVFSWGQVGNAYLLEGAIKKFQVLKQLCLYLYIKLMKSKCKFILTYCE